MNIKRVTKNLSSKFEEWFNSIEDEELKNLVKKNTIITGGSIVSLLLNEKVKDYDIYFTNFETTKAVAEYYVNKFNENRKANGKVTEVSKMTPPEVYIDDERVRIRIQSAGIIGEDTEAAGYSYFEANESGEAGEEFISEAMRNAITDADEIDGGLLDTYENEQGELYRPVFLSDNAISLSGKIQLIIRFYGEPKEIHANFDYIHCTIYWLSSNKKLYTNKKALESIITKELKYVGSKYPVCSVIRLRKLIKKGWFINAGQVLKICLQISELDLTNTKVLEEQLTGVDTAYFFEMINVLKNAEENGKEIDQTYIASIVDKIFG